MLSYTTVTFTASDPIAASLMLATSVNLRPVIARPVGREPLAGANIT
jgi:hypothetical protein